MLLAFSPAFLYPVLMKRYSHLIVFLALIASISHADDLSAEDRLFRNLGNYSIAVDHHALSVQPGVVIGVEQSLFPMLAVNIPFGGSYFVCGGLGAGNDPFDQGDLTSIQLGLGYVANLPAAEDLGFVINASLKTFRSIDYNSMELGANVLIEKKIDLFHVGLGVHVASQDYLIKDSEVFEDAGDRFYLFSLQAFIRSPLGNVKFQGSPEHISAGFSWSIYPGS